MKTELKYAPQSLNEVVWADPKTELIAKGYESGFHDGSVLLHGPNGTGKTTVANLLVKAMGGDDGYVERCSLDELLQKKKLREYILNAANLARFDAQKYFLVLHELDRYKGDLSNLWTALDACQNQAVLIVTTNDAMSIDQAVRSRCRLIEMPAITPQLALPRIQEILTAEGFDLSNQEVLCRLMKRKHLGDIRKYCEIVDDLLWERCSGTLFQPCVGATTALKVI